MPLGMPAQPILIDAAITRIDRAAFNEDSGAAKLANYFVGQIVGDMNESKSATQVVFDMVDEFIDATEGLHARMQE